MTDPVFDHKAAGFGHLRLLGELPAGENNRSYLYEDAQGQKQVGRKKNPFSDTPPLLHERHMLLFLETYGIPFAPRSLAYDEKHEFHLISYIPGEDISPRHFDDLMAERFATQLAQIHEISFDQYADWCSRHNIAAVAPEPVDETLRKYFIAPAQHIRDHCPDDMLASWVADQIPVFTALGEKLRKCAPVLVHGDLGGNMKWDGQSLRFIDWERSRFLQSDELGYIFVHGECPLPVREHVLKTYVLCRNISGSALDALVERVGAEIALMEIDKIIWRANRYTELSMKGLPAADKYCRAAREEISKNPYPIFKKAQPF